MPCAGTSSVGSTREVRGREAERSSARVTCDHDALELRRASEQLAARSIYVAARSRSRILLEETPSTERHDTRLEAEPREQGRGRRCRPRPKRKSAPATTTLGAERPQHRVGELARAQLGQLEVEGDDERLLDPGLAEQLEPALERRQELDAVAERDAWMRVERDDRRRRRRRPERGVEHAAGGRGGRRRRCRSRPRACAPRARRRSRSDCSRRRVRLRLRRRSAASASARRDDPLRVGLLDAGTARPPSAAASRSARRARPRSRARRCPS